jgi:hypothetical protein
MALPKISSPTFEATLPSTGDKIFYRPFLVREEKILLLAKETGEINEVYNAIKQVINNCIMHDSFNIDKCATFDLEYLFIKIRAVSVGNIVKFKVTDSDDGIEYDLQLDLNEVEVQKKEDYSNKLELDGNIGLIMKYPSPSVSEKIKGMTDVTEITYELIKSCIDAVWDENDVYPWDQETKEEQDMFLEMLPVEHYKKVSSFFQNMPKIEHVVEYENSNGKKKKAVFRNLNDFFMLG